MREIEAFCQQMSVGDCGVGSSEDGDDGDDNYDSVHGCPQFTINCILNKTLICESFWCHYIHNNKNQSIGRLQTFFSSRAAHSRFDEKKKKSSVITEWMKKERERRKLLQTRFSKSIQMKKKQSTSTRQKLNFMRKFFHITFFFLLLKKNGRWQRTTELYENDSSKSNSTFF